METKVILKKSFYMVLKNKMQVTVLFHLKFYESARLNVHETVSKSTKNHESSKKIITQFLTIN